MKSIISCILSLLWIASASAQGLQILNKDGSPLPASQQKVDIHTQVSEEEDGIRTVTYRLTSKVDEAQLFQIRYTLNFVGPKPTVFDGLNLLPATTSEHKQRLLFLGAFPLTAAWDSHKGMALAAGAQDDHSFLHFTMNRQPQGVQMIQTVQAALMGKGSTYTGRFHVIAFSPKYEQADALARYYQLYPDRFKRNPSVHPRLYCTSAAYYSWRGTNAERTRMAHADWEWCIHPMRHWGDLLAEHYDELKLARYIEPLYRTLRDGTNATARLDDVPKDQFLEMIRERFSNGYYTGVLNAFYNTGASRIHQDLAKQYPDALATTHPQVIDHGYDYAGSVFPFPDNTWGKELLRMYRALPQRHDVSAIAFDIPLESEVYRGVHLKTMNNVGYDEHGPGVTRAVANSMLFQKINEIPATHGPHRLGVIINANSMHQINDCFYADTIMVEANPWQYVAPWPRAARYAMGEKGVTFWEGFHPQEFDANFYTAWPKDAQDRLLRELSRFTAHRAFLLGVTYPAHFHGEYLSRLGPAMRACNNAGYKVVPGMTTAARDITLTRYGQGAQSLIAICNLAQQAQSPVIEVFTDEFTRDRVGTQASGPGLVFASMLGHEVMTTASHQGLRIQAPVQPLRVNVLQAVGTLAPNATGTLAASWTGGFQTITLTLTSNDFSGQIKLNETMGNYALATASSITLTPGQTAHVTYRQSHVQIADDTLRQMPLLDDQHQPRFVLHHAADVESRDMADRIVAFFRGHGRCFNPGFTLKLEVMQNHDLPTRAIALSLDGQIPKAQSPGMAGNSQNIVVTAEDRESLSQYVTQLLNALNALQYPNYVLAPAMDETDRQVFTWQSF